MIIKVLSQQLALKQMVEKPALVIRIFDGLEGKIQNDTPAQNLNLSSKVKFIGKYGFYNLDPAKIMGLPYTPEVLDRYSGYRQMVISSEIARTICEEFAARKEGIEYLIVHCRHGMGRSPAVAAALNDAFGLGNNDIKDKYPKHNLFVYHMVLRAAISLKSSSQSQ